MAARKKPPKKTSRHVSRLQRAGVISAGVAKKLTSRHHAALDKLSKREVDALLKMHRKVGKIRVKVGRTSHALFVL
jgi:hypothetical protein